jgi:hypothetical protein
MFVYLPNDPFFSLISKVFFIVLHIQSRLHHPLTLGLSYCICGQLLDAIRIHFFHCSHGGESMVSHDVVWDAFASIARVVGFHVLHEQTHILLLLIFLSSCQWVNIVVSMNGV